VWQHGAESIYQRSLQGFVKLAETQTRMLMAGGLRRYLMWILLVIATVPAATLMVCEGVVAPQFALDLRFTEGALLMVIATAAMVAAMAPHRITAVASIGVVGFTVALLFEILSAPDLAITQLMVETLFVVIVVLVLQHLPHLEETRPLNRLQTGRNLAIAAALGLTVGVMLELVAAGPISTHVADYYAANSAAKAYGQNVVNVVLVDFRATDTLGEITVLAVAALGGFSLLKVRAGPARSNSNDGAPP
ncbi:MAG: hydrogen gas-evolving membrane-bound hydrogenase subunit E, partial [Planctomycetota bacterium]